ncbi:MAG: hypothetical protein LBH05_00230 [Deferribacteraceae bacterium]|nr:hypothetical protein [Deferribacteraceae bacterium]
MTVLSVKQNEEDIYLLKNGMLYGISGYSEDSRLIHRHAGPFSISEILDRDRRFQLVIDDSYFFYVTVGKLNISRRKTRNVIENYLQSAFPMDLFSGFAVEENKGIYTALVFRSDLYNLMSDETVFFRKARKISTPLSEVSARYPTFLFNDGSRVYQKREDALETMSSKPEGTLQADDMWNELLPLKCEVQLPGIQKSRDEIKGYQRLIIVIAVCYILFLLSGITGIMSDSRSLKFYENQLQDYYAQADVVNSADPYGTLISRAQRSVLAPFRVMDIIKNIGDVLPKDTMIESVTVNEKMVKLEGFVKDFAGMETLKTTLESKLKKKITIDDSRQTGDQIKFTVRYEP